MKERLFFPSTERNRDVLLDVIRPLLADKKDILEIASGSGEHLCYFAPHFPEIHFHPSDIEQSCLDSIDAWRDHTAQSNVLPARFLDCLKDSSDLGEYDGIFCINMIHISPPETLGGIMSIAGRHLRKNGFILIYGPFKIDGKHTSQSNIQFEEWLKSKDPRFSVRDLGDVVACAKDNHMVLENQIPMPANNFSLVFRKN